MAQYKYMYINIIIGEIFIGYWIIIGYNNNEHDEWQCIYMSIKHKLYNISTFSIDHKYMRSKRWRYRRATA